MPGTVLRIILFYNIRAIIFRVLQMEKEVEDREGVKVEDNNEEEIKTLGFQAFGIS